MAPALHKIVVGLDYGTTYSGVSYVTSNEDSIDKIEVINQWPGTSDTASKVPTRMAYASENPRLATDTWGFTVSSTMESCSWTKLLLDKSTLLTEYDDPSLKNLLGSGMMRIPEGKLAKEVCEDFLTGLYYYTAQVLCKKYSREIYDITPVECWITVPAIWSDAAKDATKSAAQMAGFGSRPFDTVNIITEPEAATLAALKPHLNPESIDPVHPGENVMVCDCGGGTVDITTYQIISSQPRLRFKEVCVGTGGKVGSTYIDRNFNKWMIETFGHAYTNIHPKKRGPGSAMMRSFETAKRLFGSGTFDENEARIMEVEHLPMRIPSNAQFDEDESTLRLTSVDMKRFFDPVVADILRLVTSQADRAKSLGCAIDRVILVGGFGDSDYLVQHMESWCKSQEPKKVKLTCPPQCQAAVVKGAALRGLEGLKPASRIARRHYGVGVCPLFRECIDPQCLSFTTDWDGLKRCMNRMKWVIRKGQTIDENTNAAFGVFDTIIEEDATTPRTVRSTLYCCSADAAPDHTFDPSVEEIGNIVTEFSTSDYNNALRRFVMGKGFLRYFKFEIATKFSAEEGVLVFSSTVNGKQTGLTKVEFHDN